MYILELNICLIIIYKYNLYNRCPGEELNFLTTIFSRTLYHLSYRDFLIIINYTQDNLFVPEFQAKSWSINRILRMSSTIIIIRYSRNRTHICFISSKMLYQSAIYLRDLTWVNLAQRVKVYSLRMALSIYTSFIVP